MLLLMFGYPEFIILLFSVGVVSTYLIILISSIWRPAENLEGCFLQRGMSSPTRIPLLKREEKGEDKNLNRSH